MNNVLINQNFDNVCEFVKALNKARLQFAKKWIVYVGIVNGKSVELKSYDCSYLQIFRINGGPNNIPAMDIKPVEWKKFIESRLR